MKKRTIVSILCLIAVLALAVAPAVAYYSAKSTQKSNTFSISKGEKEEEDKALLSETLWVDGLKNLQPGQILPKNPVVTSKVDYDARAYLGVAVPQVEGTLEDDTKSTITDVAYIRDIGENWTLIETIPGDKNTPELQVYSYGIVLKNGESTSAAFNNIEIPDFRKFSDNTMKSIDVQGYLIQSEFIDEAEAKSEAIAFFEKELLGND